MRKLILQPPRTCNCFHLVLAKFCIFDTCNFAFPSGDWQRETHRKAVGLCRFIQERRGAEGKNGANGYSEMAISLCEW